MLHHREDHHIQHRHHHVHLHLTAKEEPRPLQVTQTQAFYGITALLAVFLILVKPVLAIAVFLVVLCLRSMHLSTAQNSSPFWRKNKHGNNLSSELTAAALSVSQASETLLDDVATSIPGLKSEKAKRVRFLP